MWFYPAFRGEAAASAGAMQRAESLFRSAHDAADRANLPEAADRILTSQALTEFRLGFTDAARSTIAHLEKTDASSPEVAIAQVELGDVAAGDRFLAAHSAASQDTLMTYVYLPQLRAALALQRGKPNDALAALDSATPYQMRDYNVLAFRAEAHLRMGQAALAAGEYGSILDNPGIDPTSLLYPLAHLGLARSYAMQHDVTKSRREYEALLSRWKNADPDLPLLRQARLEYSNL